MKTEGNVVVTGQCTIQLNEKEMVAFKTLFQYGVDQMLTVLTPAGMAREQDRAGLVGLSNISTEVGGILNRIRKARKTLDGLDPDKPVGVES